MKKLGLLVMVLGVMLFNAVSGYSQSIKTSEIPFPTEFGRLAQYLELTPVQWNDVQEINNIFVEQQQKFLGANSSQSLREKRYNHVVYGNLKLMKATLSPDQYRRYLSLLNVTHSNRLMESAISDVYLALQEGNK